MRDSSISNKYSCLISLYAKEKTEYLTKSLECVIGQTVPPEEIVIVKDGELTDELEETLSSYARQNPGLFTFIAYKENRGLWYALSQGVPACRNELIMRMDVDDWSAPNRAEKELRILADHPEIGCVGTRVIEFEGDIDHPISLVDLPEKHGDIVAFGKTRCPFRHPSLMYRKSVILAAGNYQKMPLFEDYDLYMRLASSGCKFYNIQEPLVYMRASSDFYARRGSYSYMRKMLHFRGTCLKRGDISLSEYVTSAVPHAIVCLMPNSLRELVYRHFLRKKAPISRGEQ